MLNNYKLIPSPLFVFSLQTPKSYFSYNQTEYLKVKMKLSFPVSKVDLSKGSNSRQGSHTSVEDFRFWSLLLLDTTRAEVSSFLGTMQNIYLV